MRFRILKNFVRRYSSWISVHSESISGLIILLQVLQDYFVLKGGTYIKNPSTNKLPHIAENTYIDEKDEAYAFD